jgi:molybdopterin-guanine dinucleotide biosynthesis protein A
MKLGVLLAGGRGTRLGTEGPKALAMCAGRTLLDRALSTLAACCDDTLVVAPAAMALPVDAASRVNDPPRGVGPFAAMVAGLLTRPYDEALVLAVDMPLARSDALEQLRALRGDALAVVPRPGGVAQPLAAWYSGTARERLAALAAAGERAVIMAVKTLAPKWVEDDVLAKMPGGVEAWLNVNTPEDLAAAEARLLRVTR